MRWPFLLVCFFFFSSLFNKKKKKKEQRKENRNKICCLVVFVGFLLLGIDVVILGGKESRQKRGEGAWRSRGLAGKSYTKLGSEAEEASGRQGQSNTSISLLCKVLSHS